MGLRRQRAVLGLTVFLFFVLFFTVALFTTPKVVGVDDSATMTITATLTHPDYPIAVLDVSMPAEKNTASEVSVPLEVEIGGYNKKGLENNSYVARFFNAGHAQVGEDVALEFRDSGEGIEKSGNESNLIILYGKAELPGSAEGFYYVYIYCAEGGKDKVLPFAYAWDDIRDPCCSSTNLSCLYLYSERDSLKPVSGDFLRLGCTADWCCGCLCTEGNIKNMIHLKKPSELPPSEKQSSGGNFRNWVNQVQIQPDGEPSGEVGETGEIVSGKEKVCTVLSGAITLRLNSPERGCSVLIPDGAASPGTVVCLRSLAPEALPPLPVGLELGSICFEIEGVDGELSENARISVNYTEEDLEMVGGDPSKLKLAYWDEVKEMWVVMPTQVDSTEYKLKTISRHLGIWAVASSQPVKSAPPSSPQAADSKSHPVKNFIYSKVVTPIMEACSSALNWLRRLLHR